MSTPPSDEDVSPRSAFACYNPYCLHKGRWWTSILGVTRCSNCQPPSFPALVAEEGTTPSANADGERRDP